MPKLRRPSPALIVAAIALFMSLSGTAVAAGVVPLAKHALFANNAGLLQGRSAREIASIPGPATSLNGLTADEIADAPSPASTASALVATSTAPFALAPGQERDFLAQCPVGSTALSGGFATADGVLAADTRPTSNGTGWMLHLINRSNTVSAAGNVQVVCLF